MEYRQEPQKEFEYGAILKGSQTAPFGILLKYLFEYGAILKGSQTQISTDDVRGKFEYGAILKGSQTMSGV